MFGASQGQVGRAMDPKAGFGSNGPRFYRRERGMMNESELFLL
jgi:hypothetical protein